METQLTNIAIFTANLMGIKLLEKLDSFNFYPKIVSYSHNFQRTSLSRDFSAFTDKFPITFISHNKYAAVAKDLTFLKADYFVCLDWTKDFFKDTETDATVLMGQPSLLPMYRGYGAISEQFIKGVSVSGLTFCKLADVVDGGNIVFQQKIPIQFDDYPGDFIDQVTDLAADFILTLKDVGERVLSDHKQDESKAFYLVRQRGKQAFIDFNRDALSLYNHIRGYSKPFFGAFFVHNSNRMIIWKARIESWQGAFGDPGTVVRKDGFGIEVATGNGTLILSEIEIDGTLYKEDNIPFEVNDQLS